MTFEKLKKLRLMNIISFSIMLLVNIYLAFMPFSGRSSVSIYKEVNSLFPTSERLALVNILVLIGLAFYAKFQSGNIKFRENISAKCLNCLGWTFTGINILNILQVIFIQLKLTILAFVITLLMFLLLRIINENIKDDEDVMDEKIYVRNPFSLYLGWETYLFFAGLAYVLPGLFNSATAMMILLVLMYVLSMVIGLRNNNLGILIMLILINLSVLKDTVKPISYLIIAFTILLAIVIFIIHTKVSREEKEEIFHPRKNAKR